MSPTKNVANTVLSHVAGLLALFVLHFFADYGNFVQRSGWTKASPYFFLLLMYGWIVFHNKVLFRNLFLSGQTRRYIVWTSLAMTVFSLNMYLIIASQFDVRYPISNIVSFWVYTAAGLGVYLAYTYIGSEPPVQTKPGSTDKSITTIDFVLDGMTRSMRFADIFYIESLENYIKIFGPDKPVIVRMTLKDAEDRLPKDTFIRISRSCVINKRYIERSEGGKILIRGTELKIGKVFKKYVEASLEIL